MKAEGWKELIMNAVNDDKKLNLLAKLLEEVDDAKQELRNKGYGYTGLSLLKTIQELVPSNDE